MIEVRAPKMEPGAQREYENLQARVEKQDAVIEYVAMMADIELEVEDEQQGEEDQTAL